MRRQVLKKEKKRKRKEKKEKRRKMERKTVAMARAMEGERIGGEGWRRNPFTAGNEVLATRRHE